MAVELEAHAFRLTASVCNIPVIRAEHPNLPGDMALVRVHY